MSRSRKSPVTMVGHSSWAPQSDGTFQGVQTATVQTDVCGSQGEAYQVPFVATRIGDVPFRCHCGRSSIVRGPACTAHSTALAEADQADDRLGRSRWAHASLRNSHRGSHHYGSPGDG